MARRDVDLVIRARDEARAAITNITTALEKFDTTQRDVQRTATGTDSTLDRLGASFRELRTSLAAPSRNAADEFERQRASIQQLEAGIKEAREESERFAASQRAQVGTIQKLAEQRELAAAAVRRQTSELRRLESEERRRSRRGQDTSELLTRIDAETRSLARLRLELTQSRNAVTAAAAEERRLGLAARGAAEGVSQLTQGLEQAQAGLLRTQAAAAQVAMQLARTAQLTRASLNQVQVSQGSAGSVAELGQRVRALRAELTRLGTAAGPELRQDFDLAKRAFRDQIVVARQMRGALRGLGVGFSGIGRGSRDTAQDLVVLEQRLANLQGISAAAGRRLRQVAGAAEQTGPAMRRAAAATRRLNAEQRASVPAGRQSLSVLQRIRGQVVALTTAYIGFFGAFRGVGEVIGALRTVQGAQSRLNALFEGDQEATAQELDFVRRTAARLGIQFGVLADSYTKFALATKGTNLEGEETRRIFVSVSEAARVSNLSLDNLVGVFRAVEQIANKGVFQMEELRQQLGDRLPGATAILAAGLGVTTEVLSKMLETGEVGAVRLSDFADELDRRFGGQLPSALLLSEAAIGRFQNAVFAFFRTIGEGEFQAGFIRFLDQLTETFGSPELISFAQGLSSALAVTADILGFLVRNWDLFIIAVTTLIGLRAAPYFTRLGSSIAGAAASIRTTTVAVAGLGGAIRGLLSATGAGIVFSLIGAAIGSWATRADEATEALVRHQSLVDRVKDSYEAATRAAGGLTKAATGITEVEAVDNLRELEDALLDARDELTKFLNPQRANLFGAVYRREPVRNFVREIQTLFHSYRQGAITLDEFTRQTDQLSVASRESSKTIQPIAVRIIELVRAIEKAEVPYRQARDIIAAIGADSEAAAEAQRRLAGATEDTGNTGEQSLKQAEAAGKRVNALLSQRESLQARLFEQVNRGADGATTTRTQQQLDAINARLMDATQNALNLFRAINLGDNPLTATISAQIENTIARLENTQSTLIASSLAPIAQFFDQRASQFSELRDSFQADIQRQLEAGTLLSLIDFGPVEAANREVVANAERALTEYRKITSVSPEIAAAIAQLEGVVQNASRAITDIRLEAAESEIAQLEGLRDSLQTELQDRIARGASLDSVDETRFQLEFLDSQLNLITNSTTEWLNSLQETTPAIEAFRSRVRLLNSELQQGSEEAELTAVQQRVKDLIRLRDALQNLPLDVSAGLGGFSDVNEQLGEVNSQLVAAIDNALLLAESLATGNPAAAALVAELRKLRIESDVTSSRINVSFKQIEMLFASSLSQAVNTFSRSLAEGQSITEALGNTFREFAANFLRQIADMIIQQLALNAAKAIFNALGGSGAGGGGDLGGIFGSLLGGLFHKGGIVGQSNVPQRAVPAAAFANAMRYQNGGIVGFSPGEVPVIAHAGEAILREDDPNHPANRRGQPPIVFEPRIINTFDAPSFLNEALRVSGGKEAILNVVSANRGAFRSALEI